MKRLPTAALLLVIAFSAQAATIQVEVHNPSKFQRDCVPVVIDLSAYGLVNTATVTEKASARILPSQLDDLDQDGRQRVARWPFRRVRQRLCQRRVAARRIQLTPRRKEHENVKSL